MGLNKEEIEKLENDYLKDIPYLIKFQGNNDKYAKSLLQQGDLFMQKKLREKFTCWKTIAALRNMRVTEAKDASYILSYTHAPDGCAA